MRPAQLKDPDPYSNRERLIEFLGAQIAVVDFTEDDAQAAGLIASELERKKQPIGPMDTLIAGQAVARGLTLITYSVREFSRVDGLRWEDWT